MKFSLFIVCVLVCANSFCQPKTEFTKTDQKILNELPLKWQYYWNRHDMDAMGSMLTEDVDFVNVAGVWMKGKFEAVKDHKEKHESFRFKTSVWTTDSVKIKYIKPDLAIIHLGWGISGDFENPTTPRPPRHGIFTWLVIKINGKWLLKEVQNTNIK